ncbi:MAG: hypothetical protein Q7S87_19165 [Agitococcus sp.]|nr:hypothetical protein [Agitococcus sp.]MDO9179276.1 hypothetical protein [Agitococcus sp.]
MNTIALSQKTSRRSVALLLAALILSAPAVSLAGPKAVYHSWIMRGQILSIEEGKTVICIGKHDRAKVGQVLEVIRHSASVAGGNRAPALARVNVGQVRITKIFDEHYSEAEVVSGDLKTNDTVELERK